MLKEVQEVKVGGRTRRVHVRPFAWNLHAPTHMEWTPDGRLLVVERTTGKVKDVTKGGDMEEAKPFAWGLQGPSSMCPLPDGRIILSEFWGERVVDITHGGPASQMPVFCSGLIRPYSITCVRSRKGSHRIFVVSSARSDSLEDVRGLVSEITTGTPTPVIIDIPSRRSVGTEGFTPPETWPENWSAFASKCSKNSWTTFLPDVEDTLVLAISSLGRVVVFPLEEQNSRPQSALEIAERHTIGYDLGELGGIIGHPYNHLLYVTQPIQGTIIALDPQESRSYAFDPPVVRGLPSPTCVRFTPDGEKMLVCSPTNGVVWEVTGFSS
ncbi:MULTISPECIES: hypothetical protein [Thermus]|uniref:WD40 repeat domain-containing protein n=5 Tax=Thermus TaxID=270 RepID=A0A4Y9FB38_9DEIN|nr:MULTISPECIES: hypothetical protein [Thermus]TBH14551.1 hypothetical protein ETP66_11815 [Thermus thermamylovorans]QWK21634.1 MAG: hypothetical protein KNN15_11555 [Thermus antranikianii]RTH03182.1 hypothetical protein CSW50_05820 [Thermus scotoductus]RTH14700.1 hypothetical protein CSW41_11710 [Thermus scotoductus]TFU16052.1 hypothetical protein E0489_07820 [Thermus tengchongensis]